MPDRITITALAFTALVLAVGLLITVANVWNLRSDFRNLNDRLERVEFRK